jgi:hypothetical protein
MKENVCGPKSKETAGEKRSEENDVQQKVVEKDEQQSDHGYDDDHGGLDGDESDMLVQWSQ